MSEVISEPASNGLAEGQQPPQPTDGQSAVTPETQAPTQAPPKAVAPKKPVDEEEEEEEDDETVVIPNLHQKGSGVRFIPQEGGEFKPAGPATMQITGSSRMEHHHSMSKKIQTKTETTHGESGEEISHSHTDVQESEKSTGSGEAYKAPEEVGQNITEAIFQDVLQQDAGQKQQKQEKTEEGISFQNLKKDESQTETQKSENQEPQIQSAPGGSMIIRTEQTSNRAEQTSTQNQPQMVQQQIIQQTQPQQPQLQMQIQSHQEQRHYHQKVTSSSESTKTTETQPQTVKVGQGQPEQQQPQQFQQDQSNQQNQQQDQQKQTNQSQQIQMQQFQGISPQPQQDSESQYQKTVIRTHHESHTTSQQQHQPHRQVVLQPAEQPATGQPQSPQGNVQRVQLHEAAPGSAPGPQQQQMTQQYHMQQQHHHQTQQQYQTQQTHQTHHQTQQSQQSQQQHHQTQQQQYHQNQQYQFQPQAQQAQPQQPQMQQYAPQQHQQEYRQEQRQYQKKVTSTESHSSTADQSEYGQQGPEPPPKPLRQVVLTPSQQEAPVREPGSVAPLAQQYMQETTTKQERQESYKLSTKIAGDEAWIKEERASSTHIKGTPWSAGRAVAGRQKQWPPPEQEKVYVPYKSPVVETPQPPVRRPSEQGGLGGYQSYHQPYQQPGSQQNYYETTSQQQYQQQQQYEQQAQPQQWQTQPTQAPQQWQPTQQPSQAQPQQWQQPQQFSPIQPAAPTQAFVPRPVSPNAQGLQQQSTGSSQTTYTRSHQSHQTRTQSQQQQYQYQEPYQYQPDQYQPSLGPKPWHSPQGQPSPGHVQAPQGQPSSGYVQAPQSTQPQYQQNQYDQQYFDQQQQQQKWLQPQQSMQIQQLPSEGWRTTNYQQLPGGMSIAQEQQFHDQGVDPSSGHEYSRDVHAQRSYTSRSWGPQSQQ